MLPVQNLIFTPDSWLLNGKFKITGVVEIRTKNKLEKNQKVWNKPIYCIGENKSCIFNILNLNYDAVAEII